MSGDTFVCNIAKGYEASYWSLPGSTDEIIAILLQASGLEADEVLKDADTLAALVAGTTNEATFTNYVRKTCTGLTITVNDTTNLVTLDCDDITWTSAGGAANNTIAKVVFCYKPSSGAADSAIVPIVVADYDETTTGTSITAQVASTGVMDIA